MCLNGAKGSPAEWYSTRGTRTRLSTATHKDRGCKSSVGSKVVDLESAGVLRSLMAATIQGFVSERGLVGARRP